MKGRFSMKVFYGLVGGARSRGLKNLVSGNVIESFPTVGGKIAAFRFNSLLQGCKSYS